jgi:hypothetical protein
MPPAGQPISALRDRAERHVFELLPDLAAVERRVLALLELADADRAAAAAETGLDETALRFAAKRARKALRRTGAPLSAGARCERAELMVSDRLDAPLRREDRKWLEIHLARCPRCEEHATLLAAARTDLRATFVAEPPQLPPAPEPPALEEPKAQLRIVPPPPPDPEPGPTVTAGGKPSPTGTKDGPPVAAEEPAAPEPPLPSPPLATPRAVRAVPAALKRAALLLVLLAALAAAGYGIAQVAGDATRDKQTAPWNAPDAPEVHPAPLADQ